MGNRKSSLIVGVVLLLFGFMQLLRILGNSRVAALHGSDIVTLTGCGACFGVALLALFDRINLRRD